MSTIVVRTEVWQTRKGTAVKSVVRKQNGTLVGATNATDTVLIVGKR